jgi:hypothetical protein
MSSDLGLAQSMRNGKANHEHTNEGTRKALRDCNGPTAEVLRRITLVYTQPISMLGAALDKSPRYMPTHKPGPSYSRIVLEGAVTADD